MLIHAQYLTRSRLGVFTYRRRVPKGLEGDYGGRTHIIVSLRTRDVTKATQDAARLAGEHDAAWGIIDQRACPSQRSLHSTISDSLNNQVRLSDALTLYLRNHTRGNQLAFRRDTERALGLVYSAVGDVTLETLTRERARVVLDVIVSKGNSTATVQRQLAIIRAVVNHGLNEYDLVARNSFKGLKIKGLGEDTKHRLPFTTHELFTIAAECHRLNDDLRWVTAMQMDTGARIAEVVVLHLQDLPQRAPFLGAWRARWNAE